MKKTVTGGIIALVGSIWSVAILCIAGNNLVNGWSTALGRFWSTVVELKLMALFVISVLITIFGLALVVADILKSGSVKSLFAGGTPKNDSKPDQG